jgi:SP family general alpha glucoside:H+ symporter-like MFS transporter
MPVALRSYLTTYVNLCWVIGQLIASGVLRGVLTEGNSQWGWRIPYALQWVWPIPILIGSILAPESPWWLVRHGRFEEAKQSLLRLTSGDPDFDVDKQVAMMEHTTELEKEMNTGTHYQDCFKGTDLRRTEIVCMVWLAQTVCGSTFMGYSTVFYTSAGLPTAQGFNLTIAQFALGAIGTVGSWFAMGIAGRRTLYLYGSSALCVLMLIIGCLAVRQDERSFEWAIGSMLLIFTFTYDLTIGPVCYSLVAELSSTRLKAKSIVLARNLYNIMGITCGVITNYQLTSTAWNWRAYSGFFWSGTCFLMTVWIYFRLPEPKGRTYGELDILFQNKVPARDFSKYKVDIFRGDTVAAVDSDETGGPRRASVDAYKMRVITEEKSD